jgi:PAS domain S-box-containing protein
VSCPADAGAAGQLSAASMTLQSKPAWPVIVVLTALAYALVGWLAVQLAVAPSYAAPVYPSAGIALACVWIYGRTALGGVALGAFLVNLGLSSARAQFDWSAVVMPVVVGLGAALQAQAGCWLVRRQVTQPLTLEQPRDIWRFGLLAGPVACLTSASIAVPALFASGAMPATAVPFAWWAWWIGDSLGVLIAAPVVLSLLGQPRAAWSARRTTVALPLLVIALLLMATTAAINRWDAQRLQLAFERDAQRAADAVEAWLASPLQALQAVHGTLHAAGRVDGPGLHRAADWWLRQPLFLQAVGWAEHVERDRLAAFEAAARADGPPDYRVFDREPPNAAQREVVAVRHVEPQPRNVAALGINVLSVPEAAAAVQRARRTGEASASAGFRLTQETGNQTGVVIYQPMFAPAAPAADSADSEARRLASFRGVTFVSLRMDDALAALMSKSASHLQWCLVDIDGAAAPRHLAGPAGCVGAPALPLQQQRALDFAGRKWVLYLGADPARLQEAEHVNGWLFSVMGLLAAALLGALLLIVSGRSRRIELAVDERTTSLRHEIAERRRTDRALAASEQQLRAILDSAQVGIVKTDLSGHILKANPAYCRLLGLDENSLSGLRISELTHPDDRAEDSQLLAAMKRGESEVYRREKRYLNRAGGTVHVRLTVALLRDAAGQPESTVGVVEDIGEHVALAEAQRAREEAESSNRAKSEFVSRMSHELRTPLNAMLGFAQLLGLDRKPLLAEHQRVWAGQIQQAGWHLLHMINDTLDLSRIESGALELDPRALQVMPLVQAALALVEAAAHKRQLHVEHDIDVRAQAVMGDETRIKQILTNLLSNAVKYNVDGGRIGIRARPGEAQSIEIVVSDSGLGMTRGQMDGLFQPYNRLGREHSSVEGTGIGLVISRKLAELMGGSLRAQSVAGEGSTFILTLPRGSSGSTDTSAPSELPAESPAYRQRLLHYIEDNETNVEVMRGMLLRRPQVLLSVSGSGLDGLAAMRQQRPSLILLDMHLPDIDGLELLRHLKDDDDLGDIPVVVVSADATAPRVEAALTAGAAHYVTKPLNLQGFLAILDEILDDMDTHFG